jgi:hypothetical protein
MSEIRRVRMLAAAFVLMAVACGGSSQAVASPSPASSRDAGVGIVYPPATVAQAKRLASVEGDSSAVTEFYGEMVGSAACPQPKRSVIVTGGLTGRKVAADLLKYFYDQRLDNDCGSLVLAYIDPTEYGSAYTMGRVTLSVNGSKHELVVVSGGAIDPARTSFTVDY